MVPPRLQQPALQLFQVPSRLSFQPADRLRHARVAPHRQFLPHPAPPLVLLALLPPPPGPPPLASISPKPPPPPPPPPRRNAFHFSSKSWRPALSPSSKPRLST